MSFLTSRSVSLTAAASSGMWLQFVRDARCDESKPNAVPLKSTAEKSNMLLRRRLTPVGRLALLSETVAQPSISVAVIRVGGASLEKNELGRKLDSVFCAASTRFKSRVVKRCEFVEIEKFNAIDMVREENCELTETEVAKRLTIPFASDLPYWDCTIFSHNTLLLRVHHCLADGVSMASLFGEATDQAQEIRDFVATEIKRKLTKKKSKHSTVKRFIRILMRILLSVAQLGVVFISLVRAWLCTSRPLSGRVKGLSGRSVTWASDVASVDELRRAAKRLGISVNDLFATAVARGLAICDPTFFGVSLVAAAFPIHLFGGVPIPRLRVGNHIGAVLLPLPLGTLSNENNILQDPVTHCHRVSSDVGNTLRGGLAAIVSYALANIIGMLPSSLLSSAMHASASCATIACTNIRGPQIDNLSICGRPILDIVCIMPPPPGVAVGVALSTLKGQATISVNSDADALSAHALLDSIVASLRDISLSAESHSSDDKIKQKMMVDLESSLLPVLPENSGHSGGA